MQQTRKIITAQDIYKIINDERDYIEAHFGKRKIFMQNSVNEVFTISDKEVNKVENLEDYFLKFNILWDLFHELGTLTKFESTPSDPGYDYSATDNTMPYYGAIIPEKDYHAVETLSRLRNVIPGHIRFFSSEDEHHPVKELIFLFYADSLEEARQVAWACGYDFSDWIRYGSSGPDPADPTLHRF